MTDPTSSKPRPVWLVRAGAHGQDEAAALEHGYAIVEFNEFGDLRSYPSADALTVAFQQAHPEAPVRRAEVYARQLWTLREKIQRGDTIVLPLKTRPGQVALGRVTGDYKLTDVDGEQRHVRPVQWLRPDVPRSTFKQDLLHSLGAFLTVCRIRRNEAESRVAAVLAGGADPGASTVPQPGESADIELDDAADGLDLAQAASDEIAAFIREHFPGHEMARLLEAVLQAEGMKTQRASPGPDGGADILAGTGPLGLDAPYLCVQVKATESPVEVHVLRELAGTMASFKASQGLLMSWGGFTGPALREARQDTFKIRLWDQSDLVRAIYRNWHNLSPEIQTELPLMQVWMLVREEIL